MQGNLWVRICQHMCKRTCDSFTACLNQTSRVRVREGIQQDSGTVASIFILSIIRSLT